MVDIYIGLGIITVLSVGCFVLALRLSKAGPQRLTDLLAIFTLVCMFYYMRHLWYHVDLARLLPYSNLIVIGNWFPLGAAFLAGLAWQRIPGGYLRRTIFVAALAVTSVFTLVYPLHGQPPSCLNLWKNGVCIQTSTATCSAAAAATILRAHDISATEQEMAQLCLSHRGTTWMGLYRGLKVKTWDTPWDVEVFECTHQELVSKVSSPVIISVELRKELADDPQYELYHEEWGWIPGQPHSVVLFGFLGRHLVEIGDPSVGREEWTRDDLELLWHGQGIRLVRR
jgi:hypothetical protein